MPFLNVGEGNSGSIQIHYEDHGSGEPVVLIHGWPLSGRSWEKQVPALLNADYRVITYDRRGFGDSSKPTFGYDYDTLAGDLNTLLTHLDLRNVTLVGFSMGGGEVARYVGKFGTERVKRAAFIAAITPYLLKTNDNPEGVAPEVFDPIKQGILRDRPAFLSAFLANFYNADVLSGKGISDEVIRLSWTIAAFASPHATLQCVTSWGTDFRQDLSKCTVPTLVIHGDSDRIVPLKASANRMPDLLKDAKLQVIKGAPHGLNWTHAEEVNRELLSFLGFGGSKLQMKKAG